MILIILTLLLLQIGSGTNKQTARSLAAQAALEKIENEGGV